MYAQVFVGFVNVNGGNVLGCLGLTGSDCNVDRDLVGTGKVGESVFVEPPQKVADVTFVKIHFPTGAML